MSRHLIFVYGTLKTGEPNNHILCDEARKGSARFISKGTTVAKYPLVIATKFNIPLLLYSPGNGTEIVGDIYEVDDEMLLALDQFEEHPNFYERELRDVTRGDDNVTMGCWIYFLKNFRPQLLNEKCHSNYSAYNNLGLSYCDDYLWDPDHPHRPEVRLDVS